MARLKPTIGSIAAIDAAATGSRLDLSVVYAVYRVLVIGLLHGAFLSLVALFLLVISRKHFRPECG